MGMQLSIRRVACAALFCGATALVAQSASQADKTFAKKAIEGGNAEVSLGQLAQQKATSDDIKQFGEKMVTDHTKLNEQMAGVAQNMGVTPPSGVSAADHAEDAKLKMLSGNAFDKAYIECMVKDHRKDLAEFKREAATATDPQLKDAVEHGAKVIAEHLRLAEDLAKSHDVNVASR